jgi:hypothetical protein
MPQRGGYVFQDVPDISKGAQMDGIIMTSRSDN